MTKLEEWLAEKETKRFEVVTKHYYDLFSYHASQRLTTFNFFIVSLSFLSNAYATLITRNGSAAPRYVAAAVLAFIAYLLALTFAKLDKRNEQIISINEKPLERIQEVIQNEIEGFTQDKTDGIKQNKKQVWRTFKNANEESRILGTFGHLIPIIYSIASLLTATGAAYGLVLAHEINVSWAVFIAVIMELVSFCWIKFKTPIKSQSNISES